MEFQEKLLLIFPDQPSRNLDISRKLYPDLFKRKSLRVRKSISGQGAGRAALFRRPWFKDTNSSSTSIVGFISAKYTYTRQSIDEKTSKNVNFLFWFCILRNECWLVYSCWETLTVAELASADVGRSNGVRCPSTSKDCTAQTYPFRASNLGFVT